MAKGKKKTVKKKKENSKLKSSPPQSKKTTKKKKTSKKKSPVKKGKVQKKPVKAVVKKKKASSKPKKSASKKLKKVESKKPVQDKKPEKLRKLTKKQEMFCQEMMLDMNLTQAAIRAGYSKKTAYSIGHENLRKPEIRRRLSDLIDLRSRRVGVNADYVLNTLVEIVERCRQAVPVMVKVGGEWIETGEYQFDSSGANRALELLGRHLGLFNDIKLPPESHGLNMLNINFFDLGKEELERVIDTVIRETRRQNTKKLKRKI